MRTAKPNYSDLAHQVVRDSREPLTFEDIVRRDAALQPIATKNPKSAIRNAISQIRLVINTGDGRYGWKPRVVSGSVLRLTLCEDDLNGTRLSFGEEVRDALWPAYFEGAKRRDTEPVKLPLPHGQVSEFALLNLGEAHWGTAASPEFWAWFKTLNAAVGDHLIVRVLDGEAKSYAVEFQPRASRDEAAITERNQAVAQAALAHVWRSAWGVAQWDLAAHRLAIGLYKHPVPPDPLAELWTPDVWTREAKGMWIGPYDEDFSAGSGYDLENHRDLPREYQLDVRRPRISPPGRPGDAIAYTLRVNHRELPKVWREIVLAQDHTLEDLHLMIQHAFGWGDDHQYAFFMSGVADDEYCEIGSPWSDTRRHTHQVEIGSLQLKMGDTFLYLFDFEDQHEFDMRVMQVDMLAPKGTYPRLGAQQGQSPPQYVRDETSRYRTSRSA